ncbi:LysR family transcriptional regulator [Thalassomonas actiniarum]|uniref:LysR family transcriptional regulator n=1 Tax=Thalassomonas actiniarum TaxID=485447 RepID=A0AAF0C6S0_9GAMM|nr:LysR family transcriptional regulator [Thalassomonas actiniarum]WDE02415.1 LysR family transcriptional regulator [Thalassomonas actiniarum]
MSMLTRLHYFNCVVESGSISKASNVFDVQPSSISRQLTALEKDLGVRLLNRSSRTIGLTEAGKTYYQYSQRIVSELDEANRRVNDLQQNPKGKLKLSMTVGFGECCVLPLIPAFLKQFPEIKLELEMTGRVVDLVEENVDIAIRTGQLRDSNLIATKLADNEFLLCASPQYISEHGIPDTPFSLKNYDCIRYQYAGWRDWFLMDDKPLKLEVKDGLTIRSINGQKQLILHHAGLALMPRWAVQEELNNNTLIQVLEQYTISPYQSLTATYAIYLKRELISPKIRVFLDFLKENIQIKSS